VFVEISRTPKLSEQIKDLTYGIKKLTGIEDFKFRYDKDNQMSEATEENFKNRIPSTANDYKGFMNKMQTENVKRFFSKTLMDDLTLEGNIITIHKHFDKKVQLQMVKDGNAESILEGIDDGYTVDEAASSEMFWLTKVLGDYNINKVGENFVFNNGNRSMLLKRI
jgi:membrane carboxypeptidase/penicillin-binding protein PbpC